MSLETYALDELTHWLQGEPGLQRGELEYSVTKQGAGYDRKVQRAYPATDGSKTMYDYLHEEWFQHQRLKEAGLNHHSQALGPENTNVKTAQNQLAKLVAGLYDKVALADWLRSGAPADPPVFVTHANKVADEVAAFWRETPIAPIGLTLARESLSKPFDRTPFGSGVRRVMKTIVIIDGLEPGESREEACDDLRDDAFGLGSFATHCYVAYALDNLTPEQYVLPESKLEGEI